jgi:hypothetical protein
VSVLAGPTPPLVIQRRAGTSTRRLYRTSGSLLRALFDTRTQRRGIRDGPSAARRAQGSTFVQGPNDSFLCEPSTLWCCRCIDGDPAGACRQPHRPAQAPLGSRWRDRGNGQVTTTTAAGGLTLAPVNPANAKFEFNTVADNVSQSATNGLSCSGVSFGVSNSIFTNNVINNCNITWSLTGLSGPPAMGMGNKVGDPLFVSRTLLDPIFYHIDKMSAARNAADPAATIEKDIDGQTRDPLKDIAPTSTSSAQARFDRIALGT